jgi:hypothetical protein
MGMCAQCEWQWCGASEWRFLSVTTQIQILSVSPREFIAPVGTQDWRRTANGPRMGLPLQYCT